MKRKSFFAVFVILAVLCFGTLTAFAGNQTLPSGISESEIGGEIDKYVEDNWETTAGMAYSVFSADRDISSGYYGYADKENNLKVDSDTVFEWGSVSKLLVWVSVMQLKEQGKIDLDEDIQNYLPENFLSNLKYDTPITMTDLMNHTPGFQEVYADLMIEDPNLFANLEEALAAHKPDQIFEPGTVTAYSNWGTALAAFIVEQISGMDYVEYVHANIFEPLNMEHSSIAMDLSDNEWVAEKRKELMCYDASGNKLEQGFYYIGLYPAGSCTSTLEDFVKFAKALMDENTILFNSKDTWKEFFTPTDYYDGTEIAKNYHGMWMVPFGVQTMGHGGNTVGCSSYLLINPERGIGAVVMTNQSGESVYNTGMMELIYGSYDDEQYAASKGDPRGVFKSARTVRTGPFKIISISAVSDLEFRIYDNFYIAGDREGISKIEEPYGDFYKISIAESLFEVLITGIFLLGLLASIVFMVIRLIRRIVRKTKGLPQDKPVLSLILAFAAEVITAAAVVYVAISALTYKISACYQWSVVLVAVMTIITIVFGILALIKTIKLKGYRKIYKAGNYLMLISILFMVVNVIYWDLFMWWAI